MILRNSGPCADASSNQSIISNVVVNHLMNDGVLHLTFRQVHTGILNRNLRKLATKHLVVKLLKLLLYVWNSCRHLDFSLKTLKKLTELQCFQKIICKFVTHYEEY